MNKWIIGLIGLLVGAGGGFAAGYFLRKGMELQVEEVTEEELQKIAEEDQKKHEEKKSKPDISFEDKKPSEKMAKMDTQKTQYWSMWKDDSQKYHRQSDAPEDSEIVVTTDEEMDIPEDPELEMDDEDDDLRKKPIVEKVDENEYTYWQNFKQGEYDVMNVAWFSGDDVTVDDDTFPIANPQKYLGFDPKTEFQNDISGTDEIYRKNNEYKVIYRVVKYDSSYDTTGDKEEYEGDDSD